MGGTAVAGSIVNALLRNLPVIARLYRNRGNPFLLNWRNIWMLKQSDYVVTYITHSWGGAYQYAEKARRQKKVVINL